MPYAYSTFTLPSGARATRADGSGVITGEDADLLMREIGPGAASFARLLLVQTQQMTKMMPEARSIFSAPDDPGVEQPWCAVVVTNPLIRVTVNFLLRVSRSDQVKVFPTEPAAIRWLDERAREDATRKPAAT